MLTREQCRTADQLAITRYGIPGIVLMENAGRNCVAELLSFDLRATFEPGRHWDPQASTTPQAAVVLCGIGNNGGDGLVIARHLSLAGWKVKVILFGRPESCQGDARTNLNSISRFRIPIIEMERSWAVEKITTEFSEVKRTSTDWIVDAMLGTGATGNPRSPMSQAIRVANQMHVRRMAIDIPTGLDCDTGIPSETTFRADVTCTFIGQKIGFANSKAAEYLGTVKVVGIGAPV